MIDPFPLPDDEIVSAYLDGEATAAERARIDADSDLRERLAQLQTVQAWVAAPVAPLDDLARRRLLDRALAAGPAPVPLGARSSGPSRRRAPWMLGGAAAAAVLIAAIGVGLPGSGRDDSADGGADAVALSAPPDLRAETAPAETAESGIDDGMGPMAADDAGAEPDGSGRPGDGDGAGEPGATTTTLGASPPEDTEPVMLADVGPLPDLAAVLEVALDRRDPPPEGRVAGPAGCPAGRVDATLTAAVAASVDGRAVIGLVWSSADGTRSAEVLAADTCAVLDRRAA